MRPSRTVMVAAGWVAALGLTASCGNDPVDPPADPSARTTQAPTQASPTSSAAPAADGTTRPGAPVVTDPTVAAPTVLLVLAPDGLGVVDTVTGSTTLLGFGVADLTGVQQALDTTIARPGAPQDLSECAQGARQALTVHGFQALFADGTFVGWSDGGGTETPLTTAAGTMVGSTLAQVRAAYAVSVVEGSLGPEFTTVDGAFGGFLTGTEDDDMITLLYAGETCFAR